MRPRRAGTRACCLLLGILLPPSDPSDPPDPLDTSIAASHRNTPSHSTQPTPPACGADALPSLWLTPPIARLDPPRIALLLHTPPRIAVAHGERLDVVDLAAARVTSTWAAPSPIRGLARLADSTPLLALDDDSRIWAITADDQPAHPRLVRALPTRPLALLERDPAGDVLVVDPDGAWLIPPAKTPDLSWLRLPGTGAPLTIAATQSDALIAADAIGRIWRWDLTARPLTSPQRIGQAGRPIVDLAACHGTRSWVIASDQDGATSLHPSTSRGLTLPLRLTTQRPTLAVAIDSSCTLAAASDGIAVTLWDLGAEAPESATWSLPGREPIHDILIAPDGSTLVAVGATTLRLWNIGDISRPPTTITFPDDGPLAAAHLADRLLLASPSALAWADPHSM